MNVLKQFIFKTDIKLWVTKQACQYQLPIMNLHQRIWAFLAHWLALIVKTIDKHFGDEPELLQMPEHRVI